MNEAEAESERLAAFNRGYDAGYREGRSSTLKNLIRGLDEYISVVENPHRRSAFMQVRDWINHDIKEAEK